MQYFKLLLTSTLILLSFHLFSQNETEINSEGILIPRLDRTTVVAPSLGQLVFDTTTDKFWYYDGSQWLEVDSDNQTISKSSSTVTLSNGGGSFTDDVNDADNDPGNEMQTLFQVLTEGTDAGSNKITNLMDPAADQDAATKKYVDDNDTWIINGGNINRPTGTVSIGYDGSTSPTLNLYAPTNSYIRFHNSNTGTSLLDGMWHGYSNASAFYTWNYESTPQIWGNSGVESMRLDASGNLMLGVTTAPAGYKLSVDGNIICEELRVEVSGSWPDYVFGDEYKLMALGELHNFISDNKHLPNIPAAAELEESGIAVGEMQKKMMEKIEELTLYILMQDKRIKALEVVKN